MSATNQPLVVVGVDGSPESLRAVEVGMEQARLRGASLHVVHCADVTPATLHLKGGVTTSTRDIANQQHQDVWDKVKPGLDSTDLEVTTVELIGYPADELADHCAETGAVLLVLGTRGRGRIKTAMLGSTSMRALEHAPSDVLIAKGASTA
ncbi:MAG: universal stress protein [Acidimicrobiia bacterium]